MKDSATNFETQVPSRRGRALEAGITDQSICYMNLTPDATPGEDPADFPSID
jgi:hypothetical protein